MLYLDLTNIIVQDSSFFQVYFSYLLLKIINAINIKDTAQRYGTDEVWGLKKGLAVELMIEREAVDVI